MFLLGLHKFPYVLNLSWDGKPLGTMLAFSITIGCVFTAVSLNGNGREHVIVGGGHTRRGGELELRGCS